MGVSHLFKCTISAGWNSEKRSLYIVCGGDDGFGNESLVERDSFTVLRMLRNSKFEKIALNLGDRIISFTRRPLILRLTTKQMRNTKSIWINNKQYIYGSFSCVLLPGFGSKSWGENKDDNGLKPYFFIREITIIASNLIFS